MLAASPTSVQAGISTFSGIDKAKQRHGGGCAEAGRAAQRVAQHHHDAAVGDREWRRVKGSQWPPFDFASDLGGHHRPMGGEPNLRKPLERRLLADYRAGSTATASISISAPSRASRDTSTVVLTGGAAMFRYLSRIGRSSGSCVRMSVR